MEMAGRATELYCCNRNTSEEMILRTMMDNPMGISPAPSMEMLLGINSRKTHHHHHNMDINSHHNFWGECDVVEEQQQQQQQQLFHSSSRSNNNNNNNNWQLPSFGDLSMSHHQLHSSPPSSSFMTSMWPSSSSSSPMMTMTTPSAAVVDASSVLRYRDDAADAVNQRAAVGIEGQQLQPPRAATIRTSVELNMFATSANHAQPPPLQQSHESLVVGGAIFEGGFRDINDEDRRGSSEPTNKKPRIERTRNKAAEAKEISRNSINDPAAAAADMQLVLKRCENLEKEARSLKINLSFMNRKDSEQTKQIEELQKRNDDLTEEKERLLQEIERIVDLRSTTHYYLT